MLGFFKKLFSSEMYEVEPETREASPAPAIDELPGGTETAAKNSKVRQISFSRRREQVPPSFQERQAA